MAFPIRHYWEMMKDLEERHDRYEAALKEILAKNIDCPSCCSAEIAQKALDGSNHL